MSTPPSWLLNVKKLCFILLPFLCLLTLEANPKVKLIRDNLYEDDQGNLYYASTAVGVHSGSVFQPGKDFVIANKSTDDSTPPTGTIYKTLFQPHYDPDNRDKPKIYLKDRIDTATWKRVPFSHYLVDKNHVYLESPYSVTSGARLYLQEKIDPQKFLFLYQGKWLNHQAIPTDKKLTHFIFYNRYEDTIYYNGSDIKDADAETFMQVKPVEGLGCWSAADKLRLYQGGDPCSLEEAIQEIANLRKINKPETIAFAKNLQELIDYHLSFQKK